MHKICEGRTPLKRETMLAWRGESSDIRSEATNYFCDEMMHVRKNLDEILDGLGLNRTFLCQVTGLDATHIHYWFTNHRRNLSPAAVVALAGVFHFSCSEFIMGGQMPIHPPKKVALLYRLISGSAALRETANRLLSAAPKREPPTPEALVYERLSELAVDEMKPLDSFLEICKPDYRLCINQLLDSQRLTSRLPTLFGVCTLMQISPDYLLVQDYTGSPLLVDGRRIEERYRKTIREYLALAPENQDQLLGQLLLQELAERKGPQ